MRNLACSRLRSVRRTDIGTTHQNQLRGCRSFTEGRLPGWHWLRSGRYSILGMAGPRRANMCEAFWMLGCPPSMFRLPNWPGYEKQSVNCVDRQKQSTRQPAIRPKSAPTCNRTGWQTGAAFIPGHSRIRCTFRPFWRATGPRSLKFLTANACGGQARSPVARNASTLTAAGMAASGSHRAASSSRIAAIIRCASGSRPALSSSPALRRTGVSGRSDASCPTTRWPIHAGRADVRANYATWHGLIPGSSPLSSPGYVSFSVSNSTCGECRAASVGGRTGCGPVASRTQRSQPATGVHGDLQVFPFGWGCRFRRQRCRCCPGPLCRWWKRPGRAGCAQPRWPHSPTQ